MALGIGIIYTFLQGYTFYMQRQGEIAVGCSFLCAFCIFQFIRRLHTLYYLHMKMKNIDKLNGRAFERYLTVQFRHLGYHVTLTSYSHDYGADLVLRKWGKRLLFRQSTAGEMWELRLFPVVGSIAYYKADRAMVVTNSNFESARDLAKRNEVELWGRRKKCRKISYKSLSSARWKLEKPVGGILGRGQERYRMSGK